MSIASRISSIENNLNKDWRSVESLIGPHDYDRNIENISTALDNLYSRMPKVSGSGTSLTLNNTIKGKMEIEYGGNTSQEGTPTPDSPQPIHVVSGDNTLKVEGKNLAYTGWAENFVSRINNTSKAKLETYDNKNCLAFQPDAGFGEQETKYLFKINWKENTQYTFKINKYSTSDYGDLNLVYTDGTIQEIRRLTANSWNSIIKTSTANKTIKQLEVRWRNNTWQYIDLDTFMVYEGTDTTIPYEAYTGATYPINLPNGMYLGEIGDYEDRIFETSGKNLCDIVLNNTITSTILYKTYSLKPNTQYTVSSNTFLKSIATANVFVDAGTSLTPSSSNNGVNGSRTVTSDSNGNITIGYRNYNNSLDYSNGAYYIMLNEGSTALPYEPYGTGKWYLEHKIGKVVLDENSTNISSYVGSLTNVYIFTATTSNIANIVTDNSGICNILNKIAWNYNLDEESYYLASNTLAFKINKTTIDSQTGNTPKEKLLSYLANTNFILYGSLSTPTYEEITDTTLLSQLEAIKYSYNNQTNISQTNDDLPFELSVSALKELE